MKTARVIIGAGWGDEGKGLMTDYFADPDTMVIRFNGGAQAGHTVQTPKGQRHVFHHIGAGALRGASTYLARQFICNPISFNEEWDLLCRLITGTLQGMDKFLLGRIHVAPDSRMTTIWDMMLNQIVEQSRGDARHGSCGMGIHETVVRCRNPVFATYAGDSFSYAKLKLIQQTWVPLRLDQLGIKPSPAWLDRLNSLALLVMYGDHCARFQSNIEIDKFPLSWQGPLLFEGAQGLLLDQDSPFFPYVTCSSTGLTNVDLLAKEWGIDQLDVTYVTRSYATRHGAGPFPREVPTMQFEDRTNKPNLWQGSLRFGLLDHDLMLETIKRDLTRTSLPTNVSLAVTCLDQYGHELTAGLLAGVLEAKHLYVSRGPTRDDVHQAR